MTLYLWNSRLAGWLSPGGTYVSRLEEARKFEETEAYEYAKRHYNNGFTEFGLIPIPEEILTRIRNMK